jgi:hypothetical protein
MSSPCETTQLCQAIHNGRIMLQRVSITHLYQLSYYFCHGSFMALYIDTGGKHRQHVHSAVFPLVIGEMRSHILVEKLECMGCHARNC